MCIRKTDECASSQLKPLCPCSLIISKTVGLTKRCIERKIRFILILQRLPEIFFALRQKLEMTQYLSDNADRHLSAEGDASSSGPSPTFRRLLVRLTPDASSDRGSSNSYSCPQGRRSLCYTRLGTKALEGHCHTPVKFMAAYVSRTRPLIDPT